jgi:hypothetical protein
MGGGGYRRNLVGFAPDPEFKMTTPFLFHGKSWGKSGLSPIFLRMVLISFLEY